MFGGRKQNVWTWGCLNWQGQRFYFNWSLTLKTKSCFCLILKAPLRTSSKWTTRTSPTITHSSTIFLQTTIFSMANLSNCLEKKMLLSSWLLSCLAHSYIRRFVCLWYKISPTLPLLRYFPTINGNVQDGILICLESCYPGFWIILFCILQFSFNFCNQITRSKR